MSNIKHTFNLNKAPLPPVPVDRTYTDLIFTSYTITNVEYAPGLFMNIYQPVGDTKTDRALVMTCHAGGGNYATFHVWAKYWIKLGYVATSVQYGLTVPYTAERQRQNVTNLGAAIRYMRLNAATYGIDPTKIVANGVSAGGLTALSYSMADLSDPYFDTSNNDLYPGEANGVLATATMPGNCTSIFTDFLDIGDPQSHFYPGELDDIFHIEDVAAVYDLMIAAGIPSTFYNYPDGFIGKTHALEGCGELIKADLTPKFAALVA